MRTSLVCLLTALALLAAPVRVQAEDVLKPTKAQSALRKALRGVPGPDKAEFERAYATDYLAKWKASGKQPTPTDNYALAQFEQSAGNLKAAAEGFRGVRGDPEVKDKVRDYAATAEAALLMEPALRAELGADAIDQAAGDLGRYAAKMAGVPARAPSRGKLLTVLARIHALAGRQADAHNLRMSLVREDPKSLSAQLRPIVQGLLGSAHTLDGYAALRKQAATCLGTLRGQQQNAVDEAKAKLDKAVAKLKAGDPGALGPDGKLKKTSTRGMSKDEKAVYTAARSHEGALALLAKIDAYEKLFDLLGKPAPAWTLEKAYADVEGLEALRGKVVVLDFFTTWVDQCNFPLMRDLARDYGEKGLAVVGVTVTASVVYESRYDIDADLRAKHKGGRLFYRARLASEEAPADESKAILEEGAYRTVEHEAIATFLQNHEIKWPVVMIEKDEPEAKYALEGWPHLVILDKQGRIRRFHSGEISRDEKETVAAVRKVVEALLAE